MKTAKRIKLVGEFIKNRRESLSLSQRELGSKFTPAVTTQFISNIERGITPLPAIHIPTLAQALQIDEQELARLVHREFGLRLSGKLGHAPEQESSSDLSISHEDRDFIQRIYQAWRLADESTRRTFGEACRSILNIA